MISGDRHRAVGVGDYHATPPAAAVRSTGNIGNGAPGVIRTPGTQFRKLLLYPPELRGHAQRSGDALILPRSSWVATALQYRTR
jgi:hypothetical protein